MEHTIEHRSMPLKNFSSRVNDRVIAWRWGGGRCRTAIDAVGSVRVTGSAGSVEVAGAMA